MSHEQPPRRPKRAPPPLRVKFSPNVKDETLALLDALGEHYGESRGRVIDRLVEREAKRLRLTP
jgi:hypothetical protein